MTHQPQEVLIKVMCSERLPDDSGIYETSIGDVYFKKEKGCFTDYLDCYLEFEYWYEPATRIVLTVEELQDLLSDARSEGYGDGAVEGSSNR